MHRLARSAAAIATLALALSAGSAFAQGNSPTAATTASASASTSACKGCGVVRSVKYVEEKGSGSGLGAVAGGVVGGVLGHQIGSGRGNTVATIGGAAAGAFAGNEVEKNKKSKSYWSVSVKFDDGSSRNFTYSNKPEFRDGDRVTTVDGDKRLALVSK